MSAGIPSLHSYSLKKQRGKNSSPLAGDGKIPGKGSDWSISNHMHIPGPITVVVMGPADSHTYSFSVQGGWVYYHKKDCGGAKQTKPRAKRTFYE